MPELKIPAFHDILKSLAVRLAMSSVDASTFKNWRVSMTDFVRSYAVVIFLSGNQLCGRARPPRQNVEFLWLSREFSTGMERPRVRRSRKRVSRLAWESPCFRRDVGMGPGFPASDAHSGGPFHASRTFVVSNRKK